MLSPRWRKAESEIRSNPRRSLLAVVAIGLGVFGAGGVVTAYVILEREMAACYAATSPAAATVWTPADEEGMRIVREAPRVSEVEARRMVRARVKVGVDEWRPMLLFVAPSFDSQRLDTFHLDRGKWPPQRGEILLERAAVTVARAEVGSRLTVALPSLEPHTLPVVGLAHAPGLAPAWMEGMAYGFVTHETLVDLGGAPGFDEIKLAVSERGLDKEQIRAVVRGAAAALSARGREVSRMEVRNPGEHPHATQMRTLLFLLQVFGFLALALSVVLVAGMIDSLLAQQVRQIGVMKALGASTWQVAQIYLGVVAALGLAAALPAIGLATVAGRLYAGFAGRMLNFDLASTAVPAWVFLFELGLGVLLPVVVCALPVLRAARASVLAALCDYGVSLGGGDRLLGFLRRLGRLPSWAAYAARNAVRRRGRLALTLATLATGGAMFMAATNIQAAMDAMIDAKFAAAPYDFQLRFASPRPQEAILAALEGSGGIARAEGWGLVRAARLLADRTQGNAFDLFAPPAASDMAGAHRLLAGRFIAPGDREVLVVNQLLAAGLTVGERVTLVIEGKRVTWPLIGIVQERMSPPTAYAPYEGLASAIGEVGPSMMVVDAGSREPQPLAALGRDLERRLAAARLPLGAVVPMALFRKAVEDHLLIIARLLLAMSLLVAFVGGLGLVSSMSISVMERTRELAVLRATGASSRQVLLTVVFEGVCVALASFVVALAISQPISAYMCRAFGLTFFEAPLDATFSPGGAAIWLLLVLLLAVVACARPAVRASRIPVARALAYE